MARLEIERIQGQTGLLRDLLWGDWSDAGRFQIIEPGAALAHSADERIMRVAP